MTTSAGASALGDAPAETPAPNTTAPQETTTPQEAPVVDWLKDLPDDLRGVVQTKGWKTPADAVKGYANAEKFIGTKPEDLMRVPKDDEQTRAVLKRLGLPEKPEDYDIGELSPSVDAEWFRKTAHGAGMTAAQAKAFAGEVNAYFAKASESAEAEFIAASEQGMNKLKAEWGGAYEENIEAARIGARKAGIDSDAAVALERAVGTERMLSMLALIGKAARGHEFVGGDRAPGDFGLTPEAAEYQLKRLKGDRDWLARAQSPDRNVRAAANAELQKLINASIKK